MLFNTDNYRRHSMRRSKQRLFHKSLYSSKTELHIQVFQQRNRRVRLKEKRAHGRFLQRILSAASVANYMKRKGLGQRGQTSTEYMLLVALGLTIVIISIAIATQIKGMTDSLLVRAQIERDSTISMIVR
jgi:hypothetical protein